MKPTALERYIKALAAARVEYDRAMEDVRRGAALAVEMDSFAWAAETAAEASRSAVGDYIKALGSARRSYELALEAAAKATNQ